MSTGMAGGVLLARILMGTPSAGLNLDQNGDNFGSVANALTFGPNSSEGIASKRTAGGNQFGLDFYTSSANRMSILNTGNVGIGTAAPLAQLAVNGNTRIDAQF